MNNANICEMAGLDRRDLADLLDRHQDFFIALCNESQEIVEELIGSEVWRCSLFLEINQWDEDVSLFENLYLGLPQNPYNLERVFQYQDLYLRYADTSMKLKKKGLYNSDEPKIKQLRCIFEEPDQYIRGKINLTEPDLSLLRNDRYLEFNMLSYFKIVAHVWNCKTTSIIEFATIKKVIQNFSDHDIVLFMGDLSELKEIFPEFKNLSANPFMMLKQGLKLQICKLQSYQGCVLPMGSFYFFRSFYEGFIFQTDYLNAGKEEVDSIMESYKPFHKYLPFTSYLQNLTNIPEEQVTNVKLLIRKRNTKNDAQILQFLNTSIGQKIRRREKWKELEEVMEFNSKDRRIRPCYIRYLFVSTCDHCKKEITKSLVLCTLCGKIVLCLKCSQKDCIRHAPSHIIIWRYANETLENFLEKGIAFSLYEPKQKHIDSFNRQGEIANQYKKIHLDREPPNINVKIKRLFSQPKLVITPGRKVRNSRSLFGGSLSSSSNLLQNIPRTPIQIVPKTTPKLSSASSSTPKISSRAPFHPAKSVTNNSEILTQNDYASKTAQQTSFPSPNENYHQSFQKNLMPTLPNSSFRALSNNNTQGPLHFDTHRSDRAFIPSNIFAVTTPHRISPITLHNNIGHSNPDSNFKNTFGSLNESTLERQAILNVPSMFNNLPLTHNTQSISAYSNPKNCSRNMTPNDIFCTPLPMNKVTYEKTKPITNSPKQYKEINMAVHNGFDITNEQKRPLNLSKGNSLNERNELFFKGLPKYLVVDEIMGIFSRFGQVIELRILLENTTIGGLVVYNEFAAVEKAIRTGIYLDGFNIELGYN